MKLLTFLICTRNGSSNLANCIAHIGRQTGISQESFEVIVVDNGSTDETATVAQTALAALDCTTAFVSEPREGKVYAFLRGVRASEAPYVAVIDDDNFVGEEFALRTMELFSDCNQLGMVGSVNTIDTESIPAWFLLAPGMYGCGTPHLEGLIESTGRSGTVAPGGVIAGAGSTFRKDPLLRALELGFRFSNDTRRDTRMTVTGEDTELCYLLQYCGYWFGHDPRITLRHRIDPKRLTWPYARRLSRSVGAGGPIYDAFIWMESPSSKSRGGTWWWLAARRLRKLAKLLPGMLSNRKKPSREVLQWESELGGLIRLCRERGAFTRKMREMRESRWAREMRDYRTKAQQHSLT